ncbi:hypothetical protein Ct61P_08837 [Colletotrichum tofieldiae]|nr:hypothetical protein Ct61P_08837 [Colletotrichum tofieldiae]
MEPHPWEMKTCSLRVEEEIAILVRGLEADLGGSFTGLAVQNDLLHALIFGVVVDQSSEELVGQAATNLRSLALSLSLLKGVDAALDKVADALELVSPLLSATVDDLAVSMLGLLGTLASVEADIGVTQSNVGGHSGAENMSVKLLIEDQSLGHLNVGNVQANGLGVGTEHLVCVVGDSHGHIGVKGGRAQRSAVAQVTFDERAGVGTREVGLGLDDGNVTIDILVGDCVDGRGRQLGPSGLDLERSLDRRRTTVLGKAPIPSVLEPVVLLIERVGREVEETGALAEVAVELVPVQIDTSSVKSAESVAEHLVGRLVATQSGNGNRADSKRRLDKVGQNRVGSDLEPDGLLVNRARLLGVYEATEEVDSVTGVVAKVRSVDWLILDHLAKQGGDDGHLRPVEAHRACESLKIIQDGIDLSRVEGERHLELSALEAGSAEVRGDVADLGSRATKYSLARAVDAGNVDSFSLSAERLHDGIDRAGDSEHGVGASSALLDEELGAGSNKVDGIAGRQNPSSVEGSVLAEGVAHDSAGADAPRGPKTSKCHLETAQTELHNDGRELGHIRLATIDERQEAGEAVNLGELVELVDAVTEHAVVRVEILAKAGVMGSLASEHESNLGLLSRNGSEILLEPVLDETLGLRQVGCSNIHAPVMLNATGSGCVRQVREGRLRVLLNPANESLSVPDHGSLGLASDGDNLNAAGVGLGRLEMRRILQQQARVTTGSTEVVDEDTSRLAISPLERGKVESNVDIALRQVFGEGLVDLLLDADVGRNGILLHHHQNLREGSDTRSSLAVTNVRLDSAKVQWAVGRPLAVGRGKDIGHGDHLSTITSLGTSAVHFDVVDVQRVNTSLVENVSRQDGLGRAVRVSDGDGISRVVGCGAQDHGEDIVLIGNGVIEALNNDRGTAVSTAVAIGTVVEGGTGPSLGQELATRQAGENVRVRHARETADDGGVAVLYPQRVAGDVQRSGTGGAGRVDVQTRATESEVVVDATRAESSHTTGDVVGVNFLGGVDFTPIVGSLAVEGTNAVQPRGGRSVGDVAAHLQCFVGSGQGHTLHGVGLEGLTGRHVEEPGVEISRVLNPATVLRVTGVDSLASDVVVSRDGETVSRNDAVDVQTLGKQLPKLLVAGGVGETPGHTDNGQLALSAGAVVSNGRVDALSLDSGSWTDLDIQLCAVLDQLRQSLSVVRGTIGDDEACRSLEVAGGLDASLNALLELKHIDETLVSNGLEERLGVGLGKPDSLGARHDGGPRLALGEDLDNLWVVEAKNLLDVGGAVQVGRMTGIAVGSTPKTFWSSSALRVAGGPEIAKLDADTALTYAWLATGMYCGERQATALCEDWCREKAYIRFMEISKCLFGVGFLQARKDVCPGLRLTDRRAEPLGQRTDMAAGSEGHEDYLNGNGYQGRD